MRSAIRCRKGWKARELSKEKEGYALAPSEGDVDCVRNYKYKGCKKEPKMTEQHFPGKNQPVHIF